MLGLFVALLSYIIFVGFFPSLRIGFDHVFTASLRSQRFLSDNYRVSTATASYWYCVKHATTSILGGWDCQRGEVACVEHFE